MQGRIGFITWEGSFSRWYKVHKITYKIVLELIEFSSEVKDSQDQENCVKRALFALGDRILLMKKTKIFNIEEKVDKFLKIKTNLN